MTAATKLVGADAFHSLDKRVAASILDVFGFRLPDSCSITLAILDALKLLNSSAKLRGQVNTALLLSIFILPRKKSCEASSLEARATLLAETTLEIKIRLGKICLGEALLISFISFLASRPASLIYILYVAKACSGRRAWRAECSIKASMWALNRELLATQGGIGRSSGEGLK